MSSNGSSERWPRLFGWTTLAGIELGLIGPFGSYSANLFTRVGYWTGLCWAGALILWPSLSAAVVRGRAHGYSSQFVSALVLLAACVPLATLAALGCRLFWPVHATGVRMLEWYGATLLVTGPLLFATLWLERVKLLPAIAGSASMPMSEEPWQGARTVLPPHQLELALCLQMEDHHVRLHLPAGTLLHLASLREAMEQMGDGRGLQVHRSWWVARRAVLGWTEDGRSVALVLTNGLRVPVARNRVARLRAEGWLAAEAQADLGAVR